MNEELTHVYTTRSVEHAEIIRSALSDEGIEAYIENAHQAGLTGTLKIRIHTKRSEAETARAFIDKHENEINRTRTEEE